MAIQAADDLDLVTTTLRDLGEYRSTEIVATIQEHVFLSRIVKKHKVVFDSGRELQFNVQVNPANAFRMVGMGAKDTVNIVDLQTTASVPWRRANWSYGFDATEVAMNRVPRKILDLVKARRHGAWLSAAEGLETEAWTAPQASSNNIDVFGMPYWIVPSVTQGFNGGNPFGFTAGAGGLSSVTYPNWSNYTDQYSDFTKLDMIRKWRRAAYFTNFMSPVGANLKNYSTGNEYGYFVTYIVNQRCEEAAEKQNDNLGNDIASKDAQAVFRRNPIIWVPKLDNLSGNGMSGTFVNATYTASGGQAVNMVYGINFGVLNCGALEGWWMREIGPFPLHGIQSTMMAVQNYMIFNIQCLDRRRQFILTQ